MRTGNIMKRKKAKKTLIDPKIRLLLLIYLKGKLKDAPNYLSQLAKRLHYGESNIKTHLIPELLKMNLIESLSNDGESPPYRCTAEGRKVLQPILLVRQIGLYFVIFIAVAALGLLFLASNPVYMYYWFIPWTAFGFILLISVLYFYPEILLRVAREPLPND